MFKFYGPNGPNIPMNKVNKNYQVTFPKDFRHGTALKINKAVAEKLMKLGVEAGR